MNTKYPQLIYGKLVSQQDSGYKVVAWNSEYNSENKEEVPPYAFVDTSSTLAKIEAVGFVLSEDKPILIQAYTSTRNSGNRYFPQHRYIYLKSEDLNLIKSKINNVLDWLYGEEIPEFKTLDNKLECVDIPLLNAELQQEQISILPNNYSDSLINLVLLSQDILTTGKRIILSVNEDIKPSTIKDFLDSLLSFFPASIRIKYSIAMGILDEQSCHWAKIIIKSSSIQFKLPDDLVRVQRQSKNIPHFSSDYVKCLQEIIENKENIPKLLQKLNEITDIDISINNPVSPEVMLPIIGFLPEAKQLSYLQDYLNTVTENNWNQTINLLKDNPQGLLFAGKELIKKNKSELFLEVWKLTSEPSKLLDLLQYDHPFTVSVIEQGLLKAHLISIKDEMKALCLKVIKYISLNNPEQSWKLALSVIEYFDQGSIDCCELLDASIIIPINLDVLNYSYYPQKIISLIPLLPETEQEKYWDKYLSKLSSQKWLDILSLITNNKGLTKAWEILKPDVLTKPADYGLVMMKVWDKILDQTQLKLLVDHHLKLNLKLVEILLDHGLAETKYLQLEIKQLSLKLVTAICQHIDLPKGKNLAFKLRDSSLFKENSDRFFLFDALIIDSFNDSDIYDFLNEYGYLLAYISIQELETSNLYKYLIIKHNNISKLLYKIISQNKTCLHFLVEFAQLTRISDSQQDNLYLNFSQVYLPDFAESRELLIRLIAKELEIHSNSSLGIQYPQTYNFFETKYNLHSLFSYLQSSELHFSTWENIVNCLEPEREKEVKILDRLVGKEFVVEVLKKWFDIFIENSELNRDLLINSAAWKSLNTKEQLLNLIQPINLIILTHCLIQSEKYQLIGGDVLHHLYKYWKTRQKCDQDIFDKITSSTVTQYFNNQDWLYLYSLKWKLSLDIVPPISGISLIEREKDTLYNIAWELMEEKREVKDKRKIFNDCLIFEIDNERLQPLADKVINSYVEFDTKKEFMRQCIQLEFDYDQLSPLALRLIENCQRLNQTEDFIKLVKQAGWDHDQQKRILRFLPDNSYDIGFLSSYLYREQKLNISTSDQDRDLIKKFLKLSPSNSLEKKRYKELVNDLMILEMENKGEYSDLLNVSPKELLLEVCDSFTNKELTNNRWIQYLKKIPTQIPTQYEWLTKARQSVVRCIAELLGVNITINEVNRRN
ncbi:hypothetical protein [Aphanizomenon flos-aquae]|uniref:hypothetical protein n=1 Tax=Aphanizomenon flos-aquae TaxID=1176 RepID=UPI000484E00E|nr:hypothetical protein [Aphanizomenon flos-aquae]